MVTENEKMEHEYNHAFDVYLQEQFSKKHVNDVINQHMDGHNIVKDLISQGKAVVTSHPQIADNHLFVIEPNGQAYLIRVEYKENIKERELTHNEYQIARTIYE